MISRAALKELSNIVGKEHLSIDGDTLVDFASDATKLSFIPEAVAFPDTTEQVSKILKLATKEGFPVIPRGGGTGMSGGALPVQGGLIISMSRFDRILAIDEDNLICRVEPGVITSDLKHAVEKRGLFYPPDPASLDVCTIGGNVAECAGGLRALKYGVTRDYVLGLILVLPTGEIIKTGVETMKGVAGYDLTRLVVGSEGTLAVITAVILRLIPKPLFQKTMIAFFPDVASAVGTVSHIIKDKIIPSVLELMDRLCVDCVREEMDIAIPQKAGALLLMEVDGDELLVKKDADRMKAICQKCGAMGFEAAMDIEEAKRLWEARRNTSSSLYKLRPHKISEDVVVPRNKMTELVQYLEAIGEQYNLPVPAFGHAGDGNIHVNIMLDKDNPKELEHAQTIIKKLFEKVIQMGGTITGEHGIGLTKAPYLGMEIPEAGLDLMYRIKQAFDPKGILNPGKIFVSGH